MVARKISWYNYSPLAAWHMLYPGECPGTLEKNMYYALLFAVMSYRYLLSPIGLIFHLKSPFPYNEFLSRWSVHWCQ